MASLKMVSNFSVYLIFLSSLGSLVQGNSRKHLLTFNFAQIALWAFLVVLVAAVNAAPRYFIIDDGEQGNKEIGNSYNSAF